MSLLIEKGVIKGEINGLVYKKKGSAMSVITRGFTRDSNSAGVTPGWYDKGGEGVLVKSPESGKWIRDIRESDIFVFYWIGPSYPKGEGLPLPDGVLPAPKSNDEHIDGTNFYELDTKPSKPKWEKAILSEQAEDIIDSYNTKIDEARAAEQKEKQKIIDDKFAVYNAVLKTVEAARKTAWYEASVEKALTQELLAAQKKWEMETDINFHRKEQHKKALETARDRASAAWTEVPEAKASFDKLKAETELKVNPSASLSPPPFPPTADPAPAPPLPLTTSTATPPEEQLGGGGNRCKTRHSKRSKKTKRSKRSKKTRRHSRK
jgi:hypothetical protein